MHRQSSRTLNTSLATNSPFAASPPLVLIVDDDESLRDHVALLFRHEGYRVSEARDGIEAMEKLSYLEPSVILMDLCLPRFDGCSAARQLKSDPRTAAIP